MKISYKIAKCIFSLSIIFILHSCTKKPTDYRSFLNGHEKVYPGVALNIRVNPGNNRLLLTWNRNTDPSVVKYIVYWDDGADSIVVDAKSYNSSDTLETYINDLTEGFHNFVIYSYDDKGNKSVPTNIENVKIYGSQYQNGLLNRVIMEQSYANDSLIITWKAPDTINTTTVVKYTNASNQLKTIYLHPDSSTLVFTVSKLLSNIYYKSSYKPVANAIDSFMAPNYDSVVISDINIPADKAIWKPVKLPNDANTYDATTTLHWLWNEKTGGYPEIFHTDGASLPNTCTIDLGKTYRKLSEFEEWGRTDCSCTNPVDFEVWGIADTTGAATVLPATDPEWKAESVAKGWTLLTEVKRSDDGIQGVKASLIDNPPPVRFIRIRVLHTTNDAAKYSHMSEISFWYNL